MTYASNAWPPPRPQRRVLTGRGRVMEMLERLMADKKCREVLREALTAEMRRHPVRFFRKVIMPLLPEGEKLLDKCPQTGGWRSLASGPLSRVPPYDRKGKVNS